MRCGHRVCALRVIYVCALLALPHTLYPQDAAASALVPFATHLSFSGYKCSAQSGILQASHRSKPSFTLSAYGSGVIGKAWFQKKDDSPEVKARLVAMSNLMNDKSTLARFFVDAEGDLIMEAWYPLPYAKENFSAFLDAWESDFVLVLRDHYAELARYIL